MSDIARRGLVGSLAARFALCSLDELRVIDRAVIAVEQARELRWERRVPTGPSDRDPYFHVVARIAAGSVHTRCNGRWPLGDTVETQDSPALGERCVACWRAAAQVPLEHGIVDVAERLIAEDRERAELREAARAEMVGDGGEG